LLDLFNLYFSINCLGVPDSPKLSLTATNLVEQDCSMLNTLICFAKHQEYALRAPLHFVLAKDFRIASSSNGLIVCIADYLLRNSFASSASAVLALPNYRPVADCYVSSFMIVFLHINGSSAGMKLGTTDVQNASVGP
jgi:hypothetical protein